MNEQTHSLIQTIHDSPTQLMLVAAGAGTLALSNILGVAGASRTLLEALVPYSAAAFDEFLSYTPEQYVAPKTAKLLAGRALTRARWLRQDDGPVVGLACTATVVTDRPKRGEHRAYIAMWQPEKMICFGLHLQKGARDRQGEEGLVSGVMLHALAQGCGVPNGIVFPLTHGDELATDVQDFTMAAQQLQQETIPFFGVLAHGVICGEGERPSVLLPGAFNPLHSGHLGMARAAGEVMGQRIAFEVSAANVDKPPLEPEVLVARLAQFAGRYAVYATYAPTFLQKARLFPGVTFVVGFDTAVRLLHPRYYQNSVEQMEAALAEMEQLSCRFLVAGRVNGDGRFQELTDLPIPARYQHLFQAIPGELFREDISSTHLRATGRKGAR
ncbi:MAG: hypothetical protein H6662_06765 [Ardenticatenaceae bacterium]|nr:hypothetical protein [Anaerolineales bacterium]MCB8921267.1 hypothetical protein [Ardenticatenaceae bacterium]MCB8990633.1 hypothetical protein [Ardenticatenaceae bacterium]MCB9004340.1 hypothetical protein [Ardenticatenaceae bacterium]